jgi:hypothetical protein
VSRPLVVNLDRNLRYVDHLLLRNFDLLRSLQGGRDEGVMKSYAKRNEACGKEHDYAGGLP